MEIFFDEVLTPGYAYQFVPVIGPYAYPRPFLNDKKVRTYITHGAPALPVRTLYLNSPKLRLVMGVFTFVFGWRLSLWRKTKQFWSVPFVSQKKREKYLKTVEKDIIKDIKSQQLKQNK
jgi:putative NADPH-quinone reductase